MLNKTLIRNNAIAFGILGILFGLMIGTAGFGLAALLVGIVDLFTGLLMILIRQKNRGLTMLLCGGVLLLIGFSVCSTTQLNFH
jgi:hypothetical protein